MKHEVIEKFKDVVVSIATAYGSGTGFYLKNENIIVTNFHVVKGVKEVIISGVGKQKVLAKVLYIDPMYDLAFIEPTKINLKGAELSSINVNEGEQVIAIGHPYGLKYTVTQGIVSKAERLHNNINYIQLDAAINPGNSGGPSINESGAVIGVNTFIIAGGNNLGFALPVSYLKEAIAEFKNLNEQVGLRCHSCSTVLIEAEIDGKYCNNCGAKLAYVVDKPYKPVGIAKMLEEIIIKNDKNIKLARIGKNRWEIEEGSAKIYINYESATGFVYSDAHLCMLPKQNVAGLFEYLLKENFTLEDVYFSVANKEIVMSVLVYDQYLTIESGTRMLNNLLKYADKYDDILVDTYGCIWKEEEIT